MIKFIKPVVEDLINIAGFWITPDFYKKILKQAEEF